MKIKILWRTNLNMSRGKLAAQAVHAALGLATLVELDPMAAVVVLGATNNDFKEAKEKHTCWVVRDAGRTEVEPGTETCLAFIEEDFNSSESTQELSVSD